MTIIHTTDENFIRNSVIQLNKLHNLGYVDANVAAITNGNIAGLRADIEGFALAHETEKNYLRQISKGVQRMADLKGKSVAAGTNPALTDVGTTGTLLANTIYDYRISAIDYNGQESPASAETTRSTANDGNNTHKITFAGITPVVGAESYRVYRKKSTDTVYGGYLPATKTALEAGTFADTGAALTGTADAPNSGLAMVGILTNAEVAAAKSTGTFAALLGKITTDSDDAGTLYLTTLDFGEQPST